VLHSPAIITPVQYAISLSSQLATFCPLFSSALKCDLPVLTFSLVVTLWAKIDHIEVFHVILNVAETRLTKMMIAVWMSMARMVWTTRRGFEAVLHLLPSFQAVEVYVSLIAGCNLAYGHKGYLGRLYAIRNLAFGDLRSSICRPAFLIPQDLSFFQLADTRLCIS